MYLFDIILIIISSISLILITRQYQITESFESLLSSNEKINLLKCMLTFHQLCEEHNIWYNIAFGTLLGAVRHRKIIPWDDDIDLLIYKKDLHKLNPIFSILSENYGYKVEKTWKLIRIYADDKHFIDLFPINISNNKVFRCTVDNNLNICDQGNGEWWTKWFNFPSKLIDGNKKLYQLDGLYLYGPNDGWAILRFWYGDDFLTTCKTHYLANHGEVIVTPKIVKCEDNGIPQLP